MTGVVVVGTGFGCRVHVPACRSAGLDVVALVGRDVDRTRRRADRSGVAVACRSLSEALRISGSDIIVIATPPDTHAALATEAIDAGRHVLVEKPFARDSAEAAELVRHAERAGVVALVGHEFRFAPHRITFARSLAKGDIGTPKLATFLSHLPLAAPLDMRAPSWWFDKDRGGGWLGASVSHLIDGVRWWLGEFASVSARLPMVSARDPRACAEDAVDLRFTLSSGCEGVMQQSAAVWGEPLEIIRVAGTEGTLAIAGDKVIHSDAQGTREVVSRVATDVEGETAPSDDPRHRFTHLELGPATLQAEYLRCLVEDIATDRFDVAPATFPDGRACMEVIDAIRQSDREGGVLTTIA